MAARLVLLTLSVVNLPSAGSAPAPASPNSLFAFADEDTSETNSEDASHLNPRQHDNRPNILFIMSDDHAAAAISSYGSEIVHTPNIDRIARRGMRFTNAFVTSSLCAPSRAAILTGQYGATSGFKRIGDILDRSQQTLPRLLRERGYDTVLFGKWHLRSQPTAFTHYDVVRRQGTFFDPTFYRTGGEWNADWQSSAAHPDGIVSPGYFTDIITDKSIQWLKSRNTRSPFALFVHHKAPHGPHITPQRYASRYTDPLPEPETFDDAFEDNNAWLRDDETPFSKLENAFESNVYNSRDHKEAPPGIHRGTRAYKQWAYQTMYRGYYRQVASLDENVGRLLDYVHAAGLADDTIIVYTSDNGWFLGDHGLFNKMWMYDESLTVPLIVSYPDHVAPNSVEDRFVSSLDFAPTFLDYAGVDTPSSMQGMSLRPILEGENPTHWRTSFFYHYYDQWGVPEHYGIRTREYKLIKYFDSTRTGWELYDLTNDPKELMNVFDDPQFLPIRKSLIQKLERLRKQFEN